MSLTIKNLGRIEAAVALKERDNLKSDFDIYVAAFEKILASQQTANSPLDPTRIESLKNRIHALEKKSVKIAEDTTHKAKTASLFRTIKTVVIVSVVCLCLTEVGYRMERTLLNALGLCENYLKNQIFTSCQISDYSSGSCLLRSNKPILEWDNQTQTLFLSLKDQSFLLTPKLNMSS